MSGVPFLVAVNWKLSSSKRFAKTVVGKSTPGDVCIAVAATPINVDSGL